MKLTQAAELAIRGMIFLAEKHGSGPIPLTEVCAAKELPREYMVKIFGLITRAGLLDPVRGKGGGYTLARAPDKINLLEIVEAVEGPLAINLCQHNPPKCDEVDCPVRPMWTDLQNIIREKLSAMNLANCLCEP